MHIIVIYWLPVPQRSLHLNNLIPYKQNNLWFWDCTNFRYLALDLNSRQINKQFKKRKVLSSAWHIKDKTQKKKYLIGLMKHSKHMKDFSFMHDEQFF